MFKADGPDIAKIAYPDHHFIGWLGRASCLAGILVKEHIHGNIGRHHIIRRALRITLIIRVLYINVGRRQVPKA